MDNRVVTVRAMPRPGYPAFWRGGHRWPSEGRTVCVTPELLKVLRSESLLSVDLEPESGPEAGVLELVDNFCGDREHNASAGVREENERLVARAKVLEAAAENERLRAHIARLEREAAEREHERLQREQDALLLAQETSALRAANAALRDQNRELEGAAAEPPVPPAETPAPPAKEAKKRS